MKKKKNTLLAVGLLIAVIGLGIGYALSTQSLTVEGTATAQDAASSFNVKFKSASPTTAQETTDDENRVLTSVEAKVSDNDKVATMEVLLTNAGESVTATFVVENASQEGLAARVLADNVKLYKHGTTEDYSSEYFEVTDTIVNTDIPAGDNNTMTFDVTVTLKKAFVATDDEEEHTETFDIVLEDIEAIQE